VPFNLISIAALTQSIEKELAWWRIEPKNSAAFRHRIRSICLYRHCNALHFGNKPTVINTQLEAVSHMYQFWDFRRTVSPVF